MHFVRDLDLGGAIDRRSFLRLAGYGSAGLLAARSGILPAFAATLDPSTVVRMEFDVRYRTQVHNLPRDAKDVHIWMPLPASNDGQEIHELAVVSPLPYEIRTSETYGNRLVHIETGREPESFAVEARYHVVRRRVGATKESLDATAARKYLQLTERVRVTDDIEAFAKEVVGKADSPVEVGQKVYDAIIDLLTYDKQIPGCGTGDTAWIMKHKRGKCDDYHALFMAVMISRGIPVRWEQGFPLPYPSGGEVVSGRLSGDCSGAHCWVSFHDPDRGWVPVDVSEGDKHPEMREFFFGHLTPNRFKISEGRSIVLNPPQTMHVLSTFAYAYAEADGIPLIYPANYENEVQFTITDVETSPA